MISAEEHFNQQAGGVQSGPGRFVDVGAIDPVELVDGLVFRPVIGERSMANVVSWGPHVEAPLHTHEEEQIILVLDGELVVELEGETRTLGPRDMAVIPSWVPHAAHTGDTPCVEVDLFSPPRATLVEHARKQRQDR